MVLVIVTFLTHYKIQLGLDQYYTHASSRIRW